MSGEKTSVTPRRSNAVSWKQSDLPAPVGAVRFEGGFLGERETAKRIRLRLLKESAIHSI